MVKWFGLFFEKRNKQSKVTSNYKNYQQLKIITLNCYLFKVRVGKASGGTIKR